MNRKIWGMGKLAGLTKNDEAPTESATITMNGGDRRVILTGHLSEGEITLIRHSEMPPGHEHLDAELKDWLP